ncbi:hypothetical protein RIR_jg26646.t1 [Rhizophagus irregularis DAOM 181602=DAOM 197198]|uniref:Uncharacterized protein n=1 Tax=Rhizophagus irregularis (strain DAOM 197198w) TaxID=1432141 RepID=A0A015KBI2_RHIIW|nr:hypothetical protein RirG_139200 [Rhizophagus irregularis DAOM 197198w]GET57142.1 hypothetical protein RIR_jg26646.t1 [Rhizophagus irregularis DAOM 181602=DAOM 197198]
MIIMEIIDDWCYYEDKGYYYRDGRYERKVSPMTSPIISPVYYLSGNCLEELSDRSRFFESYIMRSNMSLNPYPRPSLNMIGLISHRNPLDKTYSCA